MLRKNKLFIGVSPFGLLALTACGGGGGTTTSSAGVGITGIAQMGPLNVADVYIDLNADGELLGADELATKVSTNSSGTFTFPASLTPSEAYNIIVKTSALTTDSSVSSTAGLVDGFSMLAPQGSLMVTPATTLVAYLVNQPGGSKTVAEAADDVAKALGLVDSAGVAIFDPMTFNPFADGVDATTALKVEKVSKKISSTIQSFAAAAEGVGVSSTDAFDVSFNAFYEALNVKILANDGSKLDFSNAADMTLIEDKVKAEMALPDYGLTATQKTNFDSVSGATKAAIVSLYAEIDAVLSLDLSNPVTLAAMQAKFSKISTLAADVKTAAINTKVNAESVAAVDPDGISAADPAVGLNGALTIGGDLAVGGSVTNTVAKKVTITSTGDDSAISFTVVGTDSAGAALIETVAGANIGEASSRGSFLTVSSITAVGAPSGSVSAGVGLPVQAGGVGISVVGDATPSDMALSSVTFSEAETNLKIGDLSTVDADQVDPDGISKAAGVGNNAALEIDGILAASGAVSNAVAQKVTILSSGNDSVISFTVVGTSADGGSLTEVVQGANAGTATSVASFKTITSVTAVGHPEGTVSVGTEGVHTYSIVAGLDAASFALVDGALSFVAQPDYEAKASYSVKIQTTDNSGETYDETFVIAIADAVEGLAQKGPLHNANVFLDYNSDGIYQAGTDSAVVLTDEDGKFLLTPTQANYNIVVKTTAQTTDSSTGGVLDGSTLTAPAGSAMVTPTTTLVVKLIEASGGSKTAGQAASEIATALGFNASTFNPLTFDAFDPDADPTLALKVEKTSQHIHTTIEAFAAAAEGVGVDAATAYTAAQDSVMSAVNTKIAANAGVTDISLHASLDFNDAADMGVIQGHITDKMAEGARGLTATQIADFNSVSVAATAALIHVHAAINDVTSLDKEDTHGTFSVISILKEQIKTAAINTKVKAEGVAAVDPDGISASAAVGLNGTLTMGGALVVGGSVTNAAAKKVTITSSGDDSAISFTVVGTDAAGAALSETVAGANAGTATSAGSFLTIASITAVGDPVGSVSAGIGLPGVVADNTISFAVAGAITAAVSNSIPTDIALSATNFSEAEAVLKVGDLSTTDADQVDPDGISTEAVVGLNGVLDLNGVLAPGGSVTNAVAQKVTILSSTDDTDVAFTVVGTDKDGAALAENVTGANAGTATSTNSFLTITSITAIGNPDGNVTVGTEGLHTYTMLEGLDAASFTLVDGVLSFVEQPDYEAKTSYAVNIQTTDNGGKSYVKNFDIKITDANEAPSLTATGGAVTEDAAKNTVTGTLAGVDPEGSVVTYTAVSLTGSYGDLILDASTGAYTYTLNNNNGSVQALQSADTLTETFTVASSDGVSATSASLAFTINGADDINLLTPTAGALTENAATAVVTGTLSGSDVDGATATLSYSISGSIESGGLFSATGTYGSLSVDSSTGAYVYTLDNTDTDTNGIGAGVVLDETFRVEVSNGTTRSTKDLVVSITGVNDTPTLTAPTDGSLVEPDFGVTVTTSNTLAGADADTGEAAALAYSIVVSSNNTVGAVTDGISYSTGKYGTLALVEATGVYTYSLLGSDADTAALTSADNVTDTFAVVATDANATTGSATLSIAIAGKGITINAIANDNAVNSTEALVGFEISGRGTVGSSLTLGFDSTTTLARAGGNTVAVDSNGDWTVSVTSADVANMGQALETVTATIGAVSEVARFSIDTVDPTTTVTGVSYDTVAKQLVMTGTAFDTIGSSGADVQGNLDWTKLVWDTNGDAADAGVTFTSGDDDGISSASAVGASAALIIDGELASTGAVTNAIAQKVTILSSLDDSAISFTVVGTDAAGATLTESVTGANAGTAMSAGLFKTITSITAVGEPAGDVSAGTLSDVTSAVLTSATVLTIQLTAAKAASFEATVGFAAAGVADNVDVTAGFARDAAGGVATTDGATDLSPSYSDSDRPTVMSFTSSNVDGSYKADATINITATLSEVALAGSSLTVTLNDTGGTTVVLTNAATGTDLIGTYTVPSNATQPDLSVQSYAVTSGGAVTDLYGNTLASTAIPAIAGDADGISKAAAVGDNAALTINGALASNFSVTNAEAQKVTILSAGNDAAISFTVVGTDAAGAALTESVIGANAGTATSAGAFLTVASITAVGNPNGDVTAGTATKGKNLADNQALVIDTTVPTNAITSVLYNSTDKALVFTGSDMTTLAVAGTDVKSSLNWAKLNWDLDADDVTTGAGGKTFVVADIASAIVTSATVLTVTLTSAAAADLEGLVGFAADGLGSTDTPDTIDVLQGFSVDAAGNIASTDAAANLVPTYSDGTKPVVASFTSTTVNGSYKEGATINITANMSEVVLGGSSITATLSTSGTVVLTAATNGTTLVGTYTVPASVNSGDLSVSGFVVTSAVKDLYGNTLTDTSLPANAGDADGISKAAAVGDNAALTINGALASNFSVTNAEAQKVTILSAGNDAAISFTVVGTDAAGAALTESVTGANAGTATSNGLFLTVASITAVGNPNGDVTAGTLTRSQNLGDNQAIVIDTTTPTSTITGVSYDGIDNTIVFTGTNMGTLATTSTDVVSSLDWSKLVWDLDGDVATTDGVTFEAADFISAIVTSATTLTATLTSVKAAALEGTVGFAEDGLSSTNTPDNVDIAQGFVRDLALNVATTDAGADLSPTYEQIKPTILSFTSTSADGGYKVGDVINITATMSEAVLDGASLAATLDTGDTITLTAATNGTTLTGDYTVGTGDSSTDLTVSTLAIAAQVSDLYGNTLSDTAVPSSNLSDNSAISIDTSGPTNEITGVAYSSAAKTLVMAGAGFNTIAANGSDVKSALDWSKLVWDLDGDGASTGGVTFAAGDVTSAVVTSNTALTITLTSNKAADMEATLGFGADGIGATNTPDNIDVTAGFSRDASGNAATTDGGANLVPGYSDSAKPTVTTFTSTSADGGYKAGETVNVTATVSETILGGSAIKVTLDTGDVITLTASTNGTTMVGQYTVGAGDTSADLTISQAFAVQSAVTDTYGNTLTVTTLPASQNLGDNSALVIDTAIPTSEITSIAYNSVGGVMTITGSNFLTLGDAAADVKANFNWSKLVWDLDGDDTDAGITFSLSDITSATLTNATSLAINLTAAKQASLEATTGFAADGLGATNTGDQIDISAGFTRDAVGNASTTDAAANLTPTYSDSAKPTVSSFSSTTADGSYNNGDTVNITANMSEAILAGSQLTVTLSTSDLVELTASQNGTTLVGTYNVSATDNSSDLTISSFSLTDLSGNSDSVIDTFGNAMSATTLPGGQNLSDNAQLLIDNIPVAAAQAALTQQATANAGDTIAVTFTEAVKNTAALTTEIAGDAAYGAVGTAATTAWSSDSKTMTITLGTGETVVDAHSITFASVLDLADNDNTNITFTVDIA